MEPDRFDDVAFRIVEGPEGPPRPPRRRWALPIVTSVLVAGALAAGASALADSGSEPPKAPAKPTSTTSFTADGIRVERSGDACMAGKSAHRHGTRGDAEPRY